MGGSTDDLRKNCLKIVTQATRENAYTNVEMI
jgi:hypothetical protein